MWFYFSTEVVVLLYWIGWCMRFDGVKYIQGILIFRSINFRINTVSETLFCIFYVYFYARCKFCFISIYFTYLIARIWGNVNCMASTTNSTPIIRINFIGFFTGIASSNAIASCCCCCTANFWFGKCWFR